MSERTIFMLLIVAADLVVNNAMPDTPNISFKSKSETAFDTTISSLQNQYKDVKTFS